MKRTLMQMVFMLAFVVAGVFAADTALAKGPHGDAGRGPGPKQVRQQTPTGKHHPGPGHVAPRQGYTQPRRVVNHPQNVQRRPVPHRVERRNRPWVHDQRFWRDGARHRYFRDPHRDRIHAYYSRQFHRGYCPPGLYRQGNRCLSRYDRQWVIGRPLPRTVIFHDLPAPVLGYLGPPPLHHRFVRVAQDILLIATGTGLVVDAIDNLAWEFGR